MKNPLPFYLMDKNSSFRKAFYHLKMAEMYFEDTIREAPQSVAASCSRAYLKRIAWMEKDFATNPQLPRDAMQGFKDEINGDVMFHDSISSSCLNLTSNQKQSIERIIEDLLKGEKITVVLNENL